MINRQQSTGLCTAHRLVASLLLVLLSAPPVQAGTADRTAANPDLGNPFATVWRIRGPVVATSHAGQRLQLRAGDRVHVGDRIQAGPEGEAVLKTEDAGIVAVRPNAEFLAQRYAAEGKASDHQILQLISGSLRVISGWIARLNRKEHQIVTANATIGIRGTDHEPYVLAAADATPTHKAGTYDKVNRGETTLDNGGGELGVPAGRVGYARSEEPRSRQRALMTLLLPVLLERTPDFYVPGQFDAELDDYARTLEAQSPPATGAQGPATNASNDQASEAATQLAAASPQAVSNPSKALPLPTGSCNPEAVARYWLDHFDRALAAKDVRRILTLLAPGITATATVRSKDAGMVTHRFTRDEMVQSTLRSLASLKEYRQRRLTIEGQLMAGSSDLDCKRIEVRSLVIEQGLMNEAPYRFESSETYTLELLDGEWQAVEAVSLQR